MRTHLARIALAPAGFVPPRNLASSRRAAIRGDYIRFRAFDRVYQGTADWTEGVLAPLENLPVLPERSARGGFYPPGVRSISGQERRRVR